MGNSGPKQAAPPKTFSPQIEIINKQIFTKFGNAKHVRDTLTGREMYLKQIDSDTYKYQKNRRLYYYDRLQNIHPNLVNVIGYTTDEQKTFCCVRYTIDVYLDPMNHTMQDTLDDHIKHQNFISEAQLQLLAQQMITVLADLQTKDIFHGKIKPADIFYNEGVYKLVDPSFCCEKGLDCILECLMMVDQTRSDPKMYKQIFLQDQEPNTSKFKADVFSLGATLLSLATLTNLEELKGVMKDGSLESRIKLAENVYSPKFIKLLREMLTIEEDKRPDFLQLKEKLNIDNICKS